MPFKPSTRVGNPRQAQDPAQALHESARLDSQTQNKNNEETLSVASSNANRCRFATTFTVAKPIMGSSPIVRSSFGADTRGVEILPKYEGLQVKHNYHAHAQHHYHGEHKRRSLAQSRSNIFHQ